MRKRQRKAILDEIIAAGPIIEGIQVDLSRDELAALLRQRIDSYRDLLAGLPAGLPQVTAIKREQAVLECAIRGLPKYGCFRFGLSELRMLFAPAVEYQAPKMRGSEAPS